MNNGIPERRVVITGMGVVSPCGTNLGTFWANVRGGINSLMAEVLEDHIRLHLLSSEKTSAPPVELAEDLIDLVRAYLK